MPTIAVHTLGCKVNQYDTQAMLELFLAAGYTEVPISAPADVYLVNTCTVTGTGDRKSLQLARRLRREHPDSRLILCGCMAQHQAGKLLDAGADLVLGTQRRLEVVSLLREAEAAGKPLCAVAPLQETAGFEPLTISGQSGHTRAVLKIQEGCDHRCSYCIIPAVRGPVRSRPPEEIRQEAERLRDAGFRELVLTGIHLSSYGKDFSPRLSLTDAIRVLEETEGILRIRLGSLEPTIATEAFAAELAGMGKVCPQFHLALQSGSDTVLARMKRRYNTRQYRAAATALRRVFPRAALTTDILTGFPGETEAEYRETRAFIEEIGFSRIHVFPYSPRPDTPAAAMPDQLPDALREQRARELIELGNRVAERDLARRIGQETELLPEEEIRGCWEGYTPEYIRVRLPKSTVCGCGEPLRVRLTGVVPHGMTGVPLDSPPSA